jgi:hypothetical protein
VLRAAGADGVDVFAPALAVLRHTLHAPLTPASKSPRASAR